MSASSASSVLPAPRAVSGSSSVDQAAAGLLPVADGLWQDVYHVIAPIDDVGIAQLWRAFRTDTAVEVVLRVLPGVKGDARSEAWTRLCEIDFPYLQKAHEVYYVGGYRVEVCAAIKGVALDVWRRGRATVELDTVETIVRQLSEALGILHSSGLASLGMQPNVVFIHEDKEGLHCTLGGLDTIVRFEGEKLIPALVNPLYAPPEAATLKLHEPGPAICGWDWWTLGRVTQELILGHHVVDELLEVEGEQNEQMRWTRAESLLLEEDVKGPRAGAVELMKLEGRLNVLLRGLLSSSPEGRWGGEFVDRWLQQKSVKENYDDKRIELKFRWRGRLFTVSEAAKELQTAELWNEAPQHVFKGNVPGMLAYFVSNMPDQHLVHKQLGELLKFAGTDPLRSLPPAVSREVVLMLALLQLAGSKLIWKGRWIGGEALRTLLAEEPNNPERLAFVQILVNRSLASQIEKYDIEAARSLATSGQVVTDAEGLIRRLGWLKGKSEPEAEAIFRLAFEPDAILQAAHAKLKQSYACASDPVVEKLLTTEKPTRSELVVLAWAEPKAAQLGFITHQAVKLRRVGELEVRCQQLAKLIFWQKFEQALQAGPLIFGQRWVVLVTWLALVPLLAMFQPGPLGLLLGLMPLGLMVGLRLGSQQMQRSLIKPWRTEVKPWGWNDHFVRCRAEILLLVQQYNLPAKRAEVSTLFKQVNAERITLAKPDGCQPVASPPAPLGVLAVSVASWIIVIAVVAGSVGWAFKTPPDWAAHKKVWQTMFASAPKEKVKPKEPPTTQISWPYRTPSETPFEIVTMGVFDPDAKQSKFASERIRELLKPYKPETIDCLVAIYIPQEGPIGGLLLFDAKKNAFMGRNGILINFVPLPKMWMQIGDQRALFIEK